MSRALVSCSVFFAIGCLWGCDGNVSTPDGSVPEMDSGRERVDAGPPDSGPPDSGPPGCVDDTGCDDGIDCTQDTCNTGAGSCRHAIVPALCPAGSSCHPVRGCEMGRPCATDEDCEDEDACTVNERCDPASRVCVVDPLDGDMDGDPPRVCGGGDCDDSNPDIFNGALESCNGIDDDCDGAVDNGADASCGSLDVEPGRSSCIAGRCECDSGYTECWRSSERPFCSDLMTDTASCGECGQSCGSGTCSAGSCVCSAGQEYCGVSGCVDLSVNPAHCGSCGNGCGAEEMCVSGSCVGCDTAGAPCCGGASGFCAPGFECTDGACTSCGGWNEPCCSGSPSCPSSTPQTCVAGTCTNCGSRRQPCCFGRSPLCYSLTCISGFCDGCVSPYTVCAGLCVSTLDNPNHCGSCGNACAADESCYDGSCVPHSAGTPANRAAAAPSVTRAPATQAESASFVRGVETRTPAHTVP